jgi:hypothetical protein
MSRCTNLHNWNEKLLDQQLEEAATMTASATKAALALLAMMLMAAGSAAAIPMANHHPSLSGPIEGMDETSDIGGFYGGGSWSASDLTTHRNAAAHSDCAPVPEPGTLLLVGASLAGIALKRRRSR